MSKSICLKLISFILCGVMFLFCFVGIYTTVVADEVVTLVFTQDQIKSLMEQSKLLFYSSGTLYGEFYLLYADWIAYSAPIYQISIPNDYIYNDTQVFFEVILPFEASILETKITIIGEDYSDLTNFPIVEWRNSTDSVLFTFSGSFNKPYTGGTLRNYTYTFSGNFNAQSLCFGDYISPYSSNNTYYTGIDVLEITYNKDELLSVLDTLDITNEKLDELKDSIENNSRVVADGFADLLATNPELNREDQYQKQEFENVNDEAQDLIDTMDSVEKPDTDEILPDDSIDQIYENEYVVDEGGTLSKILKSIQNISWILTMILISVTVGVIKYVLYGKS